MNTQNLAEITELLEKISGGERALEEGRTFSISAIFEDVPDEGRRHVVIDPAEDGARSLVVAIISRSRGSLEVNLFENAEGTGTESNTELFIFNLLVGDDNEPNADITTPASITADQLDRIIIPSSGEFGIGGVQAETGVVALRPDESFAVEFLNTSGVTSDMDMSIVFIEGER